MGILLSNLLVFPRLGAPTHRGAESDAETKVSVLIPARNEANSIAKTVTAVMRQNLTSPSGQNLSVELIVLDDNSDDGTADIAARAAAACLRHRRFQEQTQPQATPQNNQTQPPAITFRTIHPLPTGWLGKNWACHQLAEQATGDVLLFIDADVTLAPMALAHLVGAQSGTPTSPNPVDLLTVWPTQETHTWGERLVVPLIAFSIMNYLPAAWPIHGLPLPPTANA